MFNAAIMLCAGRATRMRGTVGDKVLAPLAGQPALAFSLRAFLEAGVVGQFIFVTRDAAQQKAIAALFAKIAGKTAKAGFVRGGSERQDSVYNGLRRTSAKTDYVFIHDCARPLVTPVNLRALLEAVEQDQAAVLAHRVTDTIKQTRRHGLRRVRLHDLRRDRLWAMETPQVFARELITKAYQFVREKESRITDDAAAVALLGHGVTLVENATPNPKLTHPEDFAWVELLLKRKQ